MKNKKILIAVIVAVVVIVVAVVAIFLIGKMGNQSGKSDKITFEGEQNNTNAAGNNTNTSNTVDEVEYDDDIPEYAKEAADQFVAALMDEDEMDTFIEENLDSKVYAAYDKVDGDDSKVMDEYANITDDEADQVTEIFKQVPQGFKMIQGLAEAASNMANMANEMAASDENLANLVENETSNDTENSTENEAEEINPEDMQFKLKKVSNFEQSDDLEEITRVDLTINFAGEDAVLTMVFYDEIVVYIVDEDGNSFLDSTNTNADFENDGNTINTNSTDEE